MFKFQYRDIKLNWIQGINCGSRVITVDPQQELWISEIKTLDPIEKKTVESGKTALPDNEIRVGWMKTLDPK